MANTHETALLPLGVEISEAILADEIPKMLVFLIPLLLGFAFNLASTFTTAFADRWGERRGSFVTFVFRNILGIPIWAAGMGLAIRTPSPTLFASTVANEVMGWVMITLGGAIIIAALAAIRARAVMPSTRDTLVQDGIYARVRHPVHTGTLLEFTGLLLLNPTQAVMLASALGIVWLLIQTRLEEFDLIQRLPGYRDYMSRVPRFLPRLRA